MIALPVPVPMPATLDSCTRTPWWNKPSRKPGRTTPRPQEDRRLGRRHRQRWRGGEGESLVPGPSLDGQHNSGRGYSGRAGSCSRPRRRCGRCQSCAPAARNPGRDVCLSAAPSRMEHLPATPSQPWLDRRLLAAIPFLPIATTPARTAVPWPVARRGAAGFRSRFGRGRLRRPPAGSALSTMVSP